ncbi:non-ribosomal peptide synthetase [Streptomyces cadmiisoli]|uniref:Carrier domain-containing protein n=1 Tax=Streptomyces cadmiisoli TaxID=2184053 RepID=A0A2Z4JEV9_9ACTN|nr:non-ribosomal peptide synthetase [Streptomyces cadmiisoli]AWW43467.1 hypothetical protein DN051_43745 [Streptomyces cadmiisoli]
MTSHDEAQLPTYPMSFEQESIWLQDQFHEVGAGPGDDDEPPYPSRYLESLVHRLHGPVDTSALESALTALVAHQEGLRSAFRSVDGALVQQVFPPMLLPVDERRVRPDELEDALAAAITRPVPLDRPPLLRATLLRTGPEDSVLALVGHHAVMDSWSSRLLEEQISEGYRAVVEGRPPRLPDIPLQLGPYAQRQREDDAVNSPVHLEHWRTVLADAPEESTFPGDRPRSAVPSHRGGEIRFTVNGATGTALRTLARAERATPFVVLLSAWTTLLNRLSGQDDVVVGTPFSRRNGTEVKSLVGCLTDVMPVRQRFGDGCTFREVVASMKAGVWSAIRHRHIPYGHLVREFSPERVLGRFPLFQVMFTLDDGLGEGLSLPGVVSERDHGHSGRAKVDLLLNLVTDGDGYRGYLEYAHDLYDTATAQRIADRFATLLRDAIHRPDDQTADLRLVTEEEEARTRAWAQGPPPSVTPPRAPSVVRPHALDAPNRPAVVHADVTLSYAELDARADRLAASLTARGHTGARIGVCMDRSADHTVTVLGVLRAGAACLPLDPAQPAERTAFVLRDADVRVVLADPAHAAALRAEHPGVTVLTHDALPPAAPETALPEVSGDSLAYVLYTSGSTGRPKGVAMTHRGLANLIAWQRRDSVCRTGARTLHFAPLTFDVAFQEIFATWAAGGTLVVADEAARKDPLHLLALLRDQRVERLVLPFVALQQLAEHAVAEGQVLEHLREVATSGEQLYVTPALRAFFGRLTRADLQNQYGPTETHVVTALRLTGNPAGWPDRPGIGRPIDGARVDVRDRALNPLPVGVTGEICVSGVPVAQGYLGHAADANDGFTTGPDGERIYRTGDMGQLLPDGQLAFLGREDDQVKIRGYRVELQEVEAALKQVPGVADAVVVAVPGETSASTWLAAHYIAATGTQVSPSAVRDALRDRLPAHLVPAAIEAVTAFPLTASGKADRAALARALPAPAPLDAPRPAAGTATLERMSDLWARLLRRDAGTVGPDDDFFHLGGDSLLGAQLMLQLREEFGVRLGLDAMYNAPTITGLAALVDAGTVTRRPGAVSAPTLPADIVPAASWETGSGEPAPEPTRTPPAPASARRPAEGPETLQRMADLWARLLRRDVGTVGPDDDFFRLGGDSLLGAQLMLQLREEFGVRLDVESLYEEPTIAGLAALVDTDAGTRRPDADAEAAIHRPDGETAPTAHADGVPTKVTPERAPLRHVLLTGATGFLGAFLLRELIDRTDATVHCLVRARDDAHALRRLEESARGHGVWTPEVAARTVALVGDLGKPALGLDPAHHDELARTVDAVYHCGAAVNLVLPYAELEAANVTGTVEVLRLVALHRTVPVHHVSTVGVYSGAHLAGSPVTADEPLPGVDGLHLGYAQAKWAAECLIAQARERGLPVSVYRPTRIAGDTESGVCRPDDFLWLLLKGCVEAGGYPVDLGVGFDLVPVDYVSAAIVALSLDAEPPGAAHLAHGAELSLREAVDRLADLGYRLQPLPTAEWTRRIEADPHNAAFPLIGLMAPETIGSQAAALTFDGSAAQTTAAAHGVVLRPVDRAAFARTVDYFVRTGFLPAPSGTPRSPRQTS